MAWERQNQAVNDITPLLRELGESIRSTITYLNKGRTRIHVQLYKDYVASTAKPATDLPGLISDYAEYGEAKNKSEELGRRLEVPGA